MRPRTAVLACAAVGFALASASGLSRFAPSAATTIQPADSGLFSAPGRIESAHVPVSVGADATGVVRELVVEEGQTVAAGQVVARIACDDLVAQARDLRARADAATAHALLVRDGPRPEEIAMAGAQVRMAEARLREATSAHDRNASLIVDHFVAAKGFLETQRDAAMATAQRDDAMARLTMLKAGSRASEVAEASAQAQAAVAQRDAGDARVAKCEVHSPISGIVLRKLVSVGELVSVTAPQPLYVFADISRLRVRAEVDEADVDRLAVGERVSVVIGRGRGQRLVGHVSEVLDQMGRRRVMTDDPGERSDRDVLETMVDLDGPVEHPEGLPIGLRVSVLFEGRRGSALSLVAP